MAVLEPISETYDLSDISDLLDTDITVNSYSEYLDWIEMIPSVWIIQRSSVDAIIPPPEGSTSTGSTTYDLNDEDSTGEIYGIVMAILL